MITVHIKHMSAVGANQTFTGYVRIDEDGGSTQQDGEFPAKFDIAEQFASEFGGNCESVIIDVREHKPGTYTFE